MFKWLREKLNPAQAAIARDSGTQVSTTSRVRESRDIFSSIEMVNRGVNMIVNAASSLDYDIKDKKHDGVKPGMRQKGLDTLLNFRPNPYQSTNDFRQAIFSDLIFDGNVFIYFDGAFLYHLPASRVTIVTDDKTFIKGFTYGDVNFKSDEVFHFRDVSATDIYRGSSRLDSCQDTIALLKEMKEFQENFFKNGAVFGLALVTDNTLGTTAKNKTIDYWLQNYSIKKGGRKPVILDSGLKPHNIAETNFKDMDFDVSIKTHSDKLLIALGIPPILLAGGNNANISPNLRLFYLETVLPMVRKFTSALERYFGYDISPVTYDVTALQPELKELGSYIVSLVNGGVLTPDEARDELRYAKLPNNEGASIRVPANIAGSAVNPTIGGRPKDSENDGT